MRTAMTFLLVATITTAASAGDKTIWASVLVTTGTLDLVVTEKAIQRGAHESNWLPAKAGPRGRVVLHALGVCGVVAAAEKVKHRGYTKTAWALVLALAAAQSYAVFRNHRLNR